MITDADRPAHECETPDAPGLHVHVRYSLAKKTFRARYCLPPGHDLTEAEGQWMAEESVRQKDLIVPRLEDVHRKVKTGEMTAETAYEVFRALCEDLPEPT